MYINTRCPELDRLDSDNIRAKIIQKAKDRIGVFQQRVCFLIVGILFGCMFIFICSHYDIWPKGNSIYHNIAIVILQVPSYAVAYMITTLWYRHRYQLEIRKSLNSEGISTCVGCGYDLRHINSVRCPECGKKSEANHD